MKIRPGIKLIDEIEGYGKPIAKGDGFEAVYKFYRNKGDPLLFDVVNHKPIPRIHEENGIKKIGWMPMTAERTNVVYQYSGWLERQSEINVGIYYSLLGMKTMGYRKVRIAPHFFARSMAGYDGIKSDSVVWVEIFLMEIKNLPSKAVQTGPVT